MSPVISFDTRTVPGSVTGRGAQEKVALEWADITQGSVHTLPEGMRLQDYEIVGPIGEGGFGIVYLAWDHSLEQHVAIKEYLPAILASRASVSPAVVVKSQRHKDDFCLGMRSFLNEARILARFDHPSLVRVLHFWEGNGTAYMAMPYYEGPTLARALAELGRAPDEAELCGWLHPLLDALGTMHAASCFHRDIAPDNILLTDHGPVLLDFGAARRVIEGVGPSPTVVFKPGFAPIEQYGEVASMKQGAWTDLYALASVVYAAITGQPPTPSIERLMEDRMKPLSELARGRYSEPFLAAIDAALALHPRNRPQSAAEFWTLLSCGQQLQDLDLLRAVRRSDVPSGAPPAPLVVEIPSEPTMPGDEDMDDLFAEPPMELAPEPTVSQPASESDPDALEPEEVAGGEPPLLEISAPHFRPPVSNWPPLRAAPGPAQRRSSRMKVAALAAAVLCVGLVAVGYLGRDRTGEPGPSPTVARTALPKPSAPGPIQVPAPTAAAMPTPAPAPALAPALAPAPEPEPMSATEALALPAPTREPVVAAPDAPAPTSTPATEPVIAAPTAPPADSDLAAAVETSPPRNEAKTPEARAAAPATVAAPVRRSVARAPAESVRQARREARIPVAELPVQPVQPVMPAVVQVAPPPIPQVHTRCTEILQRASLGPVTAEEAAILRKGCE
ncbi:protein kinase [Variovorax sp. J2P1-59]|uniref:serine/threonine protein kinase n=1 Tax=Variovorax flavidus TaxID=3053501 RepID=UPI0025765C13|nr:serine/threonine protein kinase [Variovorax sp. J2P1-59]MDM0073385.1 protein kinase [Variovorax sp. J2P1-59]